MKKNDIISVLVEGKEVRGMITFLVPHGIVVKLLKPMALLIGRPLPKSRQVHNTWAIKGDDGYVATPEGEDIAKKLLVKLYCQLEMLINNRVAVEAFIANYIVKRDELLGILKSLTTRELKKFVEVKDELDYLLFEMQRRYFPEIKDIEMDELFLDKYSEIYLGRKTDLVSKRLCI